jgi:hypothetical protein
MLCNICNLYCDPCFEFIQHTHFLAVHLVFHIDPKKDVSRHKIGKTKGAMQLDLLFLFNSLGNPVQTFTDSVSRMWAKWNRFTIQLSSNIAAVFGLWKSIIFQHV